MLLRIPDYGEVDQRKLMDVYAESNIENTDYFYPDEVRKDVAIQKVEKRFLEFLQREFFKQADATYWILEEDDVWISGLRTCRIRNNLYYLEALETKPDRRKKGYGSLLLSGVVDALKQEGSFRLCDCVSKKNVASLKTHEKCGFQIISETGYDYLHEEADDHDYGLEYHSIGNPKDNWIR